MSYIMRKWSGGPEVTESDGSPGCGCQEGRVSKGVVEWKDKCSIPKRSVGGGNEGGPTELRSGVRDL